MKPVSTLMTKQERERQTMSVGRGKGWEKRVRQSIEQGSQTRVPPDALVWPETSQKMTKIKFFDQI